MKWEYAVLDLDFAEKHSGKSYQFNLNVEGEDGWELVSVDNGIAYFKRAINEQEPGYFTREYFDKINEMAMKQIAQAIVEIPTKQSYDD